MKKVLAGIVGALLCVGVARAEDRSDDNAGFEDAYSSVRTGARETARAGGYVILKTKEGAIRFLNEARQNSPEAKQKVADAVLTTKVKARLAADKDVLATKINVDTDGSIVTLRGAVRSQHEAARAVSHALTTDGVVAVNAMLTWPGMNERATGPVIIPKRM